MSVCAAGAAQTPVTPNVSADGPTRRQQMSKSNGPSDPLHGTPTLSKCKDSGSAEPSEPPAGAHFDVDGLLDGLAGPERAERKSLLQELFDAGVSLSELRRHAAQGTLIYLAAESAIAGTERYTAAEVADLAGVDVGFLLAARRAMGLPVPGPEERSYVQADIEGVRTAALARDAGISEEEMFEVIRTLGRGLSRSAEAMRAIALRLVLEPGIGEHELARRYALAAAELEPLLSPLVMNLLTVHLREVAETEALSAADRAAGRLPGSREMTVCFADLVGFTRLGAQVDPYELSRLAMRLEDLASEACEPPVTLVKTIGDAAMLTSAEPAPLIGAALTLIDLAEREDERFPALRAGVAIGPALSRAGDWFGQPVNLASRITAIARPGSVLTEAVLRGRAGDSYRFSYAGEHRLHGVHEPVDLYRVRSADAGG
ncbi:MAG: adenylate cyclase regulatory domain-containing protein [Solirubrobacteraceae bacterium]